MAENDRKEVINMMENEKPLQSRFISQGEIAVDLGLRSKTLRRAYLQLTGEDFTLGKA